VQSPIGKMPLKTFALRNNMNKLDLRNKTAMDIQQYLSNGGTIITEKAYNPRKKNPANGKQKHYFTSIAPKKRPSQMYDFIETKL